MQPDPKTIALFDALITKFEGPERLTAFQDGGGVWTIGRGHTGPEVHAGLVWVHQQSLDAFVIDTAPIWETIPDGKSYQASAAYGSLGYNAGRGALHSVLVAGVDMMQFVHDKHGNVEAGLVLRRTIEKAFTEI